MTFLEQLQAHKGGLVRLKTELYWYTGRSWDGCPGRVCLLLDSETVRDSSSSDPESAKTVNAGPQIRSFGDATACFLVDGSPHWIWISEKDVEILK